ncbi:MAG: EMC3/TMCO1 family protein, partial [Candidatus Bathyarchaeia archaeon]
WNSIVGFFSQFTYDVMIACIFTAISAFIIVSASVGLSRIFVDVKLQREYMALLSEYRSLLNEAKRTGDPKILSKVKKRKAMVEHMGSKVSMQNMKMMAVSMIVFFLMFNILTFAFQGRPAAVVILYSYSEAAILPFYIWYTICSFTAGRILFKLLGLEASGQLRSST